MNYILTEKELLNLLSNNIKLTALESGGVDNWEWYSESINEFLTDSCKELNKENLELEDLAKEELSNYKTI